MYLSFCGLLGLNPIKQSHHISSHEKPVNRCRVKPTLFTLETQPSNLRNLITLTQQYRKSRFE